MRGEKNLLNDAKSVSDCGTNRENNLDLAQVRRYPLATRQHKVDVADFGQPIAGTISGTNFLTSLPDILSGKYLRAIIDHARQARRASRRIVFAMGGHVVKTGTGPHIIRLMREGFVTDLVLNGAFAIHDFEVALIGKTSEVVDDALQTGDFGFALETGRDFNLALARGWEQGLGYGESIATWIIEHRFPFAEQSVLVAAHELGVTTTIHSSIGAEIIDQHPECNAQVIGELLMRDFHTMVSMVADLSGGMWFNIGSAVLLPEVFLKAMSIAINLGADPRDFVTVNMDMILHYRPDQNVVRRPVAGRGRGYHLIGHHEIMISLLTWLLLSGCTDRC